VDGVVKYDASLADVGDPAHKRPGRNARQQKVLIMIPLLRQASTSAQVSATNDGSRGRRRSCRSGRRALVNATACRR